MASAPQVAFFSPFGAAFGVDLGACLQRVVDSGWYVLGPQVREFETAFARHVGVRHAALGRFQGAASERAQVP